MTPAADLGIPDSAWYSLYLSIFGIIIGIGVFWIFNTTSIAILGASLPLVLGTMQGLVNSWFMLLWFLIFISVYYTMQWFERS